MLVKCVLNNLSRLSQYKQLYQTVNRKYSKKISKNSDQPNLTLGDFGTKYEVFRDEDAEIIMDVNEERQKYASLLEAEKVEERDPFAGINLNRGVEGVFDIDDLVSVLRRENIEDLFVASVPKNFKYVDYICIVSGRSQRHMAAIAQFVRKVYKHKRHKSDIIPVLEGSTSKDWMAVDLGNIALHIFSREARNIYDLETLWSVGSEFDHETHKKDPVVTMLERHSVYLHDLQPAK